MNTDEQLIKENIKKIKKIINIMTSVEKIDITLLKKYKKNEEYLKFLNKLLTESNEYLKTINKNYR